MNAKEQAIKDIKSELDKCGKSFIQFRRKLNPIMKKLVNNQLKAQKQKDAKV